MTAPTGRVIKFASTMGASHSSCAGAGTGDYTVPAAILSLSLLILVMRSFMKGDEDNGKGAAKEPVTKESGAKEPEEDDLLRLRREEPAAQDADSIVAMSDPRRARSACGLRSPAPPHGGAAGPGIRLRDFAGLDAHRRTARTSLTWAASKNLRPPYFWKGTLHRASSSSSGPL